jgi:predicted phage terminase large subunit-like protein
MMDRTDKELRELALNSLYFFGRAILGFDWLVRHVHGRIANLYEDPTNKRLQFTLPRGFLKTTFATITYSLWRVLPPRDEYVRIGKKDPLHDPNARILIVQNTMDNARARVNVLRQIIEGNRLIRGLFPEIIPESFFGTKTRWSDSRAQIRRVEQHPEATWEAAGVGTRLVSRHYTEIIEDDIIAPKKDDVTGTEAIPTRDDVEKAIGFHKSAISLLANPKDGRIINIGTRWAHYDVINYIETEQMPPFVQFKLAAVDDEGKAVYPERFDLDTLESIKHEQGTYIYSSQYLNKPYDTEKMVFHPGWFKSYQVEPEDMAVYMSVDPAISKRKKSDYSVVIVAGVTYDRGLYVLEYTRERLNPTELIQLILSTNRRRNPEKVIIETVAWQQALSHFTRKEAMENYEYLPVVEFNPRNKKEVRIRGLQPIAQRGKLYTKPQHTELRKELTDFPYGEYDDLADALATIKIHARFPASPQEEVRKVGETLKDVLEEIRESRRTGMPEQV